MRRFPPPGGHQSTSARPPLSATTNERRSTEAPMEYEWQQPRAIPVNSPFRNPLSGIEDGERAKKRTHYEAMDIDTPPRPQQASFPPEATMSANPFGFGRNEGSRPLRKASSVGFDAQTFDAKQALGLGEAVDASGVEDMSIEESATSTSKDLSLLGASISSSTSTSTNDDTSARRRKAGRTASRASTRKASGPRIESDEGESEGEYDEDKRTASKWKAPTKSNFSFQVHHHHSQNPANTQFDHLGVVSPTAGRWLNSKTPYVLLGYLQFLSLALLAVLFLSLSLLFLYTLYVDIQSRLRSLTSELRAEILACAKMYVDNRCEPATRLPALERKCAGWEECMGREIVVVGKTRVVAETLADVVNGFVDVISFKTMSFVILTLGLCIYGSSVALSLLPSRPAPRNSRPGTPHAPHYVPLGYYPSHPQGVGYLSGPGTATAPWMQMGMGPGEEKSGLGAKRGLEVPR
ncbi:BQ2448_6715 [Microbotryum intermedium]|uniref:BQ2448_6715 protein n=1 Tax=Microbotryum intermedium TaxID=269621 RepID=A0A238FQK2_9BASI|nr:BQ2448_6715 [Microbotryum intermedium]